MPERPDAAADLLARACAELLRRRDPRGCWPGSLSSSALATAVAAFALRQLDSEAAGAAAGRGEHWLAQTVTAAGCWGDTPASEGNLSTTLLCAAALAASPVAAAAGVRQRAHDWLAARCGDTRPAALAGAVLDHYGGDRTFSVPILTLGALSGMLGPSPECWRHLPQLPFELALLPRQTFRWLGLPVVSYALPALIAMGVVRHRRGPRPRVPWRRPLVRPALGRLSAMQPAGGGFLEAVPLTGFVVMSLAAAGFARHPVVREGTAFLLERQRPDGSWPIDSNLSTWLTTGSVNALGSRLPPGHHDALRERLLRQQTMTRHPYTGAAPGGWAWTDLPGGVPDADDTAGALLALHRLDDASPALRAASARGLTWLLDLTNRDGGMPTFCRGWGRLPFDRSCPDITAHAIRAYGAWLPRVDARLAGRLRDGIAAGVRYLARARHPDGCWIPLWFGNQAAPGHRNPVYGTARVLQALATGIRAGQFPAAPWMTRSLEWLLRAQGPDGGWGGDRNVPASVEETALAITAAALWLEGRAAAARGIGWLRRNLDPSPPPAPIGLYFASLWYHEELYPLLFTTECLRTWVDSGGEPARL
ncbi:MAG: squalene--hopene cyclase [Lentisphaeria bacterium]|nr:squalene--hopene cyclase [Lentisphaeria bacterium]